MIKLTLSSNYPIYNYLPTLSGEMSLEMFPCRGSVLVMQVSV